VKAGKNVLAVRIFAPTALPVLKVAPKSLTVNLDSHWKVKAEFELPALAADQLSAVPQPASGADEPQKVPSSLFNGMVNPVIPYAIRGALWYQGEANAGRAFQYRTALPLLITDWRKRWNEGDFPFYICQLANFMAKKAEPGDSAWAELRDAQSSALSLPNTGRAVLIDLGEAGDIHPRHKREVGERLAKIALARDYKIAEPYSGPAIEGSAVEGGKIRVKFGHTDGGLVAAALPATYIVKSVTGETAPLVRNSPNSEVEGFAICGADHNWVWAEAKIDGNSVVVWSDKVAAPVAVRYAWADNPTCNLANGAGLPAAPFRTDDFPAVTQGQKY
jgi:sialate O-acetylesterase